MVPDVSQQLRAISQTVAKTIIPAIDPDDAFAQEQAGLVLASLTWILDVEEEQERYFRVEVEDQRALLAELARLEGLPAPDAPTVAEDTVAALRSACAALKQRTSEAFDRLTAASGQPAESARALFDAYGRRQLEREASWCRMTGFPEGSPAPIGAVLAAQQGDRRQPTR